MNVYRSLLLKLVRWDHSLSSRPLTRIFALCLTSIASLLLGCAVDLTEAIPRSTPDDEPADETVVRVRFWNLTGSEAVDVEFFATNQPLVHLPDDLFVAANRITASVGVAGTGIIQPVSQDTIEFPCSPALTIGTAGGSFIDNETGELHGMGTARWAQEGPLGLCGGTVTFLFLTQEDQFTTKLFVGPLLPAPP